MTVLEKVEFPRSARWLLMQMKARATDWETDVITTFRKIMQEGNREVTCGP